MYAFSSNIPIHLYKIIFKNPDAARILILFMQVCVLVKTCTVHNKKSYYKGQPSV